MSKRLEMIVSVLFLSLARLIVAQTDNQLVNTANILMRVYQATGGSNWRNSTNWSSSKANIICSWAGIQCWTDTNSNTAIRGQVRSVSLANNKLVGTVPSDIWSIPYLQTLDLRDNPDMDLDLSNVANANFLEYLSLSNTGISDLSEIGNAQWLVALYITECNLSGKIPSGIFNLKYLQGLYANFNPFTSTIPASIGRLTNLQELYMYKTQLSGKIPTQIGLLTKLQVLALSDNYMTGTIPTELSNLSNLRVLALQKEPSDFYYDGTTFTGRLPSFSTFTSLTELYLSYNSFTGKIPSSFLKTAPLDQIINVDLSYNLLTGTISSSLGRLSYLNIYLTGNRITGINPTICSSNTNWMNGAVELYGCDAILCPAKSCAPEGRDTDSDDCTACDWNYMGGTSKLAGLSQKEILEKLYSDTNGPSWFVKKGEVKWTSTNNECKWFGITCDDNGDVTAIELENRTLSGYVGTDLFSLRQLNFLNLGNNLIKFDFQGISSAVNLEYLYLHSCGLTALKNINELASVPLKELSLNANKLQMTIPSVIYSIQSLEAIWLSYNRFFGTISTRIGSLTNLQMFYAYANELTGTIPSQIGLLKESLLELVLSENDLTGTLPSTFNDMWALEFLSIHQSTNTRGGLSGKLVSFASCDNLKSIHLSSNSLSGRLPSEFLKYSHHPNEYIEVDLSYNQLTGAVPSTWSLLEDLYIDLAGNKITSVAPQLCDMGSWQNGAVDSYSCDAILCPIGTYNDFGRRNSNQECFSCESAAFMGATDCGDQNNQRLILLKLFHSLDGWGDDSNWGTSTGECNWNGVECDSDDNVVSIDISNQGLFGTPSVALFDLPYLKSLVLSQNQISFDFTGIENAVNLETLYLSDCNVDSLSGIGQSPSLIDLHLTSNKLTGTIPLELFQLSQLKYLYMSYNSFSGRLPSQIGQLTNLEELFILQNELKGQIPATIGKLTKLQYLTLGENLFSGTLPEELNLLTKLEVLSLGGRIGTETNALTGPLLSFRNLRYLHTIYLNNNLLTGTIPVDFLDGISDKYVALEVDLELNRLQGTVPASLVHFQSLNIILSGNMISGLPVTLCSQMQWMEGRTGSYSCNAILCPPDTFSSYGYTYDDSSFCVQCDSGMKSAKYFGSYECKTSDQFDADEEVNTLIDFFKAMNGPNWDLNTGWLDFSVSICDWNGILCSSTGRVEGISLPYLSLEGTVPDSFFTLQKLKFIDLSGNYITMDLQKANEWKLLTFLNLDDTGLSSITGIKQLSTSLLSLHVAYNQISTFPQEIFQLTKLQVLFMSNNPMSGSIPSIFDLPALFYFVCNSCGFQGAIPSELGSKLPMMAVLSLANNKLTGPIPSSLSNLSKLQFLDLSGQNLRGGGLTGSVPKFASTALTQLYLSKNKLTGSIPVEFLKTNVSEPVELDFRGNQISGSFPTTLNQFTDVTIYLSDNKISKIDSSVCENKTNWNGGDVLKFGCDGLLCPPGYFNALGRQTEGVYGDCSPCANVVVYGATSCDGNQSPEYILTKFYLELNGDRWKSNDYWLQSPNVCYWYGITCDNDGRVVSINLETNGLIGNVPSELFNLETLSSISLRGNAITFLFNGIEKLKSLQSLVLSSSGLTDITGIGKATSLQTLILTSNSLTSLPSEVYGLTNLRSLMLNYNGITGTLSSNIGKLTNLESLYLYHNKIVGTIPPQIGYLSNLAILSVGENFLNGPLPNEINFLRKLERLSLNGQGRNSLNSVSRTLVQSTSGFAGNVPSLHLSPYLREVYIGDCNLTGSLPNNFLAGIDNYNAVITMDLSGNSITGTLPAALRRFQNLNLVIAGNKISDIDESFCYESGWMNGLVGLYGCDAFACPKGSYNIYGRQISDAGLCIPCPYLSSATSYGSTTCSPDGKNYSEKEILELFYSSTSGAKWTKSTNWKSVNMSICQWYGVTCDPNDNVIALKLPSNNLIGTVTPYIFGLKFLVTLNLSDNKIELPLVGIGSAVSLEQLYIDRTLTSSLMGIDQAQSLKIFHCQSNNFFGTRIPVGLFDLQSLEILQLADSHFGGSLPSQIGKLVNLKELWCHDNDLTGRIPSEIGYLQNLNILSLSENKLYGTLPNEIGSLQSLQSLFIDHFTRPGAGLSGTLPSLSNAPYLSEVHLNSNSLTGRIPTDFLSGVDDTNRMIVVGLRSNRLSGRIPRELGRFDNLNIDLAENWITGISSSLCLKSNWMDGRVGVYGCNAILCPNSTANRYGKQTSNSSSCIVCAEAESSDSYYGTTQCLTDVKRKERAILTNLYNSCGGKKWFKSEHWLNNNVDICDWYGISCKPGGSVQAILLGSNNLVGSIPSDLFDIENLQWLWLYSNPITFSFVGVQNAVHLQSLLLGSTGLKSLNGISGAFELKELDIRFNSVSGPFPSELLQLVNLESLLMSKNYLTGSIPDLGSLSNLKILQLGQNQISGQLNPFATLGSLSTLDISSNKISGTIPRNFLQAVSSDVNIFVDLSNNYIEGTVPGDLGRFDQVSLYLQDNFITGISSNLCSMRSWNGGDVGSYDCSGILCPAQTYAVGSGRAGSNNTQCLLCGMAKYYGQTKCEDLRARKPSISSSSNSEAHGSRVIRGVLAGLGVIVSGVIITYAVYRYKQGREY